MELWPKRNKKKCLWDNFRILLFGKKIMEIGEGFDVTIYS